jgi:hypothetical protein
MQNVRAAAPWNRQSFEHNFDSPAFTVKSTAMPGFTLRVWRTDGMAGPPPQIDVDFMASQPWNKHKVTHLRNEWHQPVTSYDLVVQTLPAIPEDVIRAHTPDQAKIGP